MGFLLGMAGKLAAGQRVRTLQAKMMRVQSQLRRVTREYSDMEKYINSWKNNKLNEVRLFSGGITQAMSMFQRGAQEAAAKTAFNGMSLDQYLLSVKDSGGADPTLMNTYSQLLSQSATNVSGTNQLIQTFMQQEQSNIENYVEMLKETQLEPLKDTEDELQLEKDSLESEIQLAQQDYEACKEMEKAGAKNLKPDYTGQG